MEKTLIMRSYEEIKTNLDETLKELEEVQRWANSASDRYFKDKNYWGEADPGEMYAAESAVSTLTSKVNTLNWVLEI